MCNLSVTQAAFTPTGRATLSASTTSVSVALPTNGSSSPAATTVILTNLSTENNFYVVLGDSSVVSSTSTGFPVPIGQSVALSIGANTYIAAVTDDVSSGPGLAVSTGF